MVKRRTVQFRPAGTIPGGRLTTWAKPLHGMKYSLGLDFAYGIPGRDFDWGVLLDSEGQQVANLAGHWGMGFTPHVKDLVDYFGGPSSVFIVGEATATGLPILRDLYDSGYSWLYHHREAKTAGHTTRDILGHVPGSPDITVLWLQEDLTSSKPPVIRDAELHDQLCKYGFQPKSSTRSIDESTRDSHLKMGAPDGEHDDGVRAFAMANAGRRWVPRFVAPKPVLPTNSIGRRLMMDDDDQPADAGSYWSR